MKKALKETPQQTFPEYWAALYPGTISREVGNATRRYCPKQVEGDFQIFH